MIRAVITILCCVALSTTSAAAQSWSGIYRKADGGMVGIGEFHEFGPSQILVDYETGEVGPLLALPDGKTGIGRAIGDRTSPPARILERNAGDIFLDGRPLKTVPVDRRPFEIRHDTIRLAGELVRPNARPKGVMVFVHGSGDGPRRAYDLWTNFFLSGGWAVVVFDKRGSGQSTGDWHDANFVTLAGDVRSVLRWTRAQSNLAKLPLGLWGASQAGWIIPQLAAENAVDFAIVQAGASTPVDEFIGRAVESELKAYAFPPEEIAKARAYYELDVAVSRGTRAFNEIEKAYREASAAGAEWLIKAPDRVASPDRRFMAVIAGFDPASYWRNVRIPILALFGGKDHVVPVEPNRRRLESLLAEAGNTEAEIVTLPDDNHLNLLANTGVRTEYSTLSRFDPKYFQALTRFLERVSKPDSR
jgi:alpha-beta hydrolase superfamily lysophospholipase